MTKFAQVLTEDIKTSGLDRRRYAEGLGISPRALRHWLEDTSPGEKHMEKIMERFPDLKPADFENDVASSTEHQWDTLTTKIMLAKMKVIDLTFIFEWLVLSASVDERRRFRKELGTDWEHFMNLGRALVNETSRETIQKEKRLNHTEGK